jgi:hypothetical protein
VFKTPRVVTDIIGRYPNFPDLPRWIRRDSLRNMSESTLNMSVCSKSDIKLYLFVRHNQSYQHHGYRHRHFSKTVGSSSAMGT